MKNTIQITCLTGMICSVLTACGGTSTADLANATAKAALKTAATGEPACAAQWSSSTSYTGGQTVSYQNENYKANWWTENNNPSTNNGGAGTGMPWTKVSACVTSTASTISGSTSTTSPTKTTTTTTTTTTSTPVTTTNPVTSTTSTPTPTLTTSTAGSVPGWPSYIAMGAIGGPGNTTPTATSRGGDDDFGGRPVDSVFKYAGVNGNGDPGVIDPPTNAYRMTSDLNAISQINQHPSRVAIVEYTAQMSGGQNFDDFTNGSAGLSSSNPAATYLMARHFASLGADAQMLAGNPVVFKNQNFYGSLLMNPDLLGAIQQNSYISSVNSALPAGAVNLAVAQALCLLTNTHSYTNVSDPNGMGVATYIGKTYTGTPVQILNLMLKDGYPEWSFDGQNDAFWNTSTNNSLGTNQYSQVGFWFNGCLTTPKYSTAYTVPTFPGGFSGWVQANNWLIRTFAPKGTVTFGWQDNMWAVGSGNWVNQSLTAAQVASQYSTPLSQWLNANAPATLTNVGTFSPDFFLFDRYEMDDSAAPAQGTLYNARSWDNYLSGVGQFSKANNNIPVMLWQIPGSHIPNTTEAAPELYQGTAGSYVFSTAPVYFFGDSNLSSNLGNMIMGPAGSSNTNTAVGNFALSCGDYNCLTSNSNYRQYLLQYNGLANNYNWSIDNGKLALAANNNVFAILWGGGNTTNVIKNFSNTDDHGWLANKLIKYYTNPISVVKH